jgi:nitrite reductase (cytochrome c-552)
MRPVQEVLKEKPWLGWIIFTATVILVFLLGMLASSIVERRAEAVFAYTPQIDISEFEPRNEKWGAYFPREYNTFKNTADTTFRSK